MKAISQFDFIYIHRSPVDMRKSINGLCVIVDQDMKLDLKKSALFIFCNRRRNRLKILYFDKSGFALWFKRLEEAKFSWPRDVDNAAVIEIATTDLELLLEGLNIWTRFEKIEFENVV
jgi:transposase